MRTGNIRRLVIDTYAWIEFFIGSKKGEMVKEYLLGENEVYTPSIVLAEIARKYLRENVTEKIVKKRLELIAKISIIIDIDEKLSLETGKAYLELVKHAKNTGLRQKPSLVDAIILATAKKLQAKIITGDKHFKGLKETIWIGDH